MKGIGYFRVSRVGQREGDSFLSPTLQRESIERVCQREGIELIDVYEELDRSGGATRAAALEPRRRAHRGGRGPGARLLEPQPLRQVGPGREAG